jgi:1-acyl-sn-glycerol-3-phosphate acyltransferase
MRYLNIQPYGVPDRRWSPKLTPWWFQLARYWRRRALKKQLIERIDVQGLENLQAALDSKQGVLMTPNHSFHWDSYCLLEGAERLRTPFYFMTAWQVFAQSNWFDCESMRRCGCFSVDREGTDIQSLKTAVDIMQNRPQPLVIFPEGDVYHTNDRVTPFRDGAAAMALMAARKAVRPVVIIPVAIKRWYTQDPTPSMLKTLAELERRLYWRPRQDTSIRERILHVAKGLLTLKELEYFGQSSEGEPVDRLKHLASSVLWRCEDRYSIRDRDAMLPERIKEVRRRIIQAQQECSSQAATITSQTAVPATTPNSSATLEQQRQWASDMDDMFLVTQLYSYPGDYMEQNPTWERQAETLDKLEEDALGATYPSVRGPRRVIVRFDQPYELPRGKSKKLSPAEVTDHIEHRVQAMLDELNAQHSQD